MDPQFMFWVHQKTYVLSTMKRAVLQTFKRIKDQTTF